MPITNDIDIFIKKCKNDISNNEDISNTEDVSNIEDIANIQEKRMNIDISNMVRLTPENVNEYIGREIMFRTRNDFIFKIIKSVSKTGKTVYIDHPDLQNALQIVSRKVFVIDKISL